LLLPTNHLTSPFPKQKKKQEKKKKIQEEREKSKPWESEKK